MIVLHPNSVCDVCLDGYTDANAPHSIACGHSFCLRCLGQLSRRACPLCRRPFVAEDVRKLHVDRSNRQNNAPYVEPPQHTLEHDEQYPPTEVTLRGRITRIVLDGGKASDVRELIDEVRNWLSGQPSDEHCDLRAAYLLLFKYTDLQYKVKEQKVIIEELNQLCDEMKEKMRSERELADTKYQELAQKRMNEMEKAIAVERALRDRIDEIDAEWRLKYERCYDDCHRLREELKHFRHNPLPTPPRSLDTGFMYTAEADLPLAEPMDDDDIHDRPKSSGRANEDRFQLSPIPATATLPVSNLPNRQNFRPLTAEESDIEDLKAKKNNAYLIRSIDPIPIRPGIHRMTSSSSILTRSGFDNSSPRSLPRPSTDVHMASCSSSPTATFQLSRDRARFDEPAAASIGVTPDGVRTRPRGATVNSYVCEQEVQKERARKLSDVLDRHRLVPTDIHPPLLPKEFLESASSPESSAPATRTTSPVSPPACIQSPLLQRPSQETGSRASTAALEAERARAMYHKDSSIRTSPTSLSPTAAKEREFTSQYSPHSPQQSYQLQRSTGSIRRKPIPTPTQASGLTRSLWSMQEPQKV